MQQALSADVLDNLVLYHRTNRHVNILQDFCLKIVELSKQVQILNDKIKNFASQ